MTPPVLDGLTVLEFGAGSQAAALAGVLLADNGARVIKVEPPEGDRLRTDAPSAALVLDRGKESIVADLRTTRGRAEARELAAAADVLVAGFGPGVAERFGIAYADLEPVNPALVHCAINGFGSTGPYAALKAYEHVVQAKAGSVLLGQASHLGYRPGPIFSSAPFATTGAGHLAATGIVSALLVREKTGRGQRLEVPLFNGLNAVDYFGTMAWQWANGKVRRAEPAQTGSGSGSAPPASRYSYMPATKDGRFVFITAMLPHQARAVLRGLGIEKLLEEPRYAAAPRFATAEDAQDWENEIWAAMRTRTFAEWDPILRADSDIAYELLRTSEEGLDHPQARHNGEVVTIEDPVVGPVEQVGPLVRFEATPARVDRPAPAVGEHAGPPKGPRPTTPSGTAPAHPLAGITIVEFGYFFAMPFGTAIAAALGARVIKIEDLRGDPMRNSFGGPEVSGARVLEGKESVSVDIRTPEGRQIVHDLVARADVFANGFRPGVAERQGLDYATLKNLNPSLVYLHATGYGLDGEFADRPIYAQCASSVAGAVGRHAGYWMNPDLAAEMDVEALQAVIMPRLRGLTDGDSNAALGVATALSLALYHRTRTGEGQFLSTSMIGGNLWAYIDDANRYAEKPPTAQTDPDFHGLFATYRLYRAAQGWVFLAVPRQKEWEAFAAGLDRPDLAADARFTTPEQRRAHDDELTAVLEEVFAERAAAEWESLFVPLGVGCVACSEVNLAAFTNTDPVLRESGLVTETDHPSFGRVLRHGVPVLFSDTPGRIAPGCLLGQHTRSVLEELGYSPKRITELVEAGITRVTVPPQPAPGA